MASNLEALACCCFSFEFVSEYSKYSLYLFTYIIFSTFCSVPISNAPFTMSFMRLSFVGYRETSSSTEVWLRTVYVFGPFGEAYSTRI